MANEIQANFSARILNGTFVENLTPLPASITQTNVGGGGLPSQTIPTADTLLAGLTGLSTNGWAFLQNLDATNYLLWGPDDGNSHMVVCGKLKPGEWDWLRIAPTVILRAKADTNACKMHVLLLED